MTYCILNKFDNKIHNILMDIKKNFGARLKELRIKKGLTQEKISEQIGIQPENYSRIEKGFAFPKPENIAKLSRVLQCEVSEMFQFSNLDNYEEIFQAVLNKIESDKDITILIYRFLKSLGKV